MQQNVQLAFLEFTPRKRKRNKTNNVANGIPTIRSLNHLLPSGSKMYKKTFSFPELWVAVCLVEIIFNRNQFQDFFTIYYIFWYIYMTYILHLLCHFLGNLCHKKCHFLRNWCLSEKAIMAINMGFCTVRLAICFLKQVHLHRSDTATVN